MIINIIIVILSYFIGNILGGKVLNIMYKQDLTDKGSKNIGARNAGRIFGTKAFLLVLTVDFFKGFLVVILLKLMNANYIIIAFAMLFVILGHIKPVLNGFVGGKGVATFMGALFGLFSNLIFILILGVLLIGFITRSLTIGFYSSLPVLIYIYYLDFKNIYATLIFSVLIMLMLFVARNDISNSFNNYFYPKLRNK